MVVTPKAWKLWLPMLGAPLLALGAQLVAYALATPLCARQAGMWIHAVFGISLAVSLVLTRAACSEGRCQHAAHRDGVMTDHSDRHGPQQRFLAEVAAGVAAISALAVLAMWIVQIVLSPCQA